ncbi:hypothetical protein R1flu_005538 [Riccia fluitans]|uniref:LysM domain-containing protein n=1 Tax=Riccia fluitans TaxID=41844 RepID=A0ABD1YW77_9MARC
MTAVETNVHFREHDIEFLQNRARLWLQAVLGERFDDQRGLAELIADGNILYRVAKYVIKDMTGKSPGPETFSPRVFSEAAVQGKTSGKYLPYSNVDTFLKMCRQVGLSDVDLFTPPDAVEGKDMRRVCVAIRALAKKGRAQHIRLPDFDDVSRPLPMPKEKVGEIREHLQHVSSSPVNVTAPSPDLDMVKSERIITKFLSSTKSSPLEIPERSTYVAEPSPSDTTFPATPGPGIKTSDNSNEYPSTPAATLVGLSSPTLRKPEAETESLPIQSLSSGYNFVPGASPSPLPTFKPEWIPLEELGLEEFATLSEDANSQKTNELLTSSADQSSAQLVEPRPEDRKVLVEPSPEEKKVVQYKELRSQSSMRKSNSEARLSAQFERSESKYNEAPPKLQSPVKTNTVTRTEVKEPTGGKPVSKETSSKDLGRSAGENGLRSSLKEPAESPKPIQINVNLRVWGPVIAGVAAFFGTLLLVRTRDPPVYEVKRGDTLTKISKKAGRANWEELVKLNPNIKNPDLIYPSERLKLPS